MAICETPVCPEGCEAALPEVEFDACNPDVHFGQVSDVFITNFGNPMDDVNDPAEWTTRLALPSNDPERIVQLQGIGDKPAAEENVLEISKGRKVSGLKNHTVNFRIDEVSDKNYEMMRKFECQKLVLAWYKTFEGKLYGGNNGVHKPGVMISFNHVIPEDASALETLQGTITWRSSFHPCRTDYPLQGDLTGES